MKWNICLFISCSRYDSTWWQFMNQPKQSCVNIMELIVYYAYMTVWTFLYLWIYLFSFFSPNLCCDIRAHFTQILLRLGGYCEWWGTLKNMGHNFHCIHRAQILLQPTPSIKYCTYTLIISSDFSEALSIKSK